MKLIDMDHIEKCEKILDGMTYMEFADACHSYLLDMNPSLLGLIEDIRLFLPFNFEHICLICAFVRYVLRKQCLADEIDAVTDGVKRNTLIVSDKIIGDIYKDFLNRKPQLVLEVIQTVTQEDDTFFKLKILQYAQIEFEMVRRTFNQGVPLLETSISGMSAYFWTYTVYKSFLECHYYDENREFFLTNCKEG